MTSTTSYWISVCWTAAGIFLSGAILLLALPWALLALFPGPRLPEDVIDILNNADIGKIQDDLEALMRAVEALMTAVPAGEASAETLRDILASTRDEVRGMGEAFTGLASVLTAASADRASVLASFTDEVRAMMGASTDLVGELTAIRSEVGAMREEVQRLRTVVATLVNALSEASSELRLLRIDVSEIQRAGNSPLRSHLG
ncbi:hypothetical protein TGAMA5MH_10081 [Trichoderma gamsii]|uniref:Uncharacterized protein n=1 Tax=Trichoderma gamsii TaxID=398673 RepID=A0A2K0SXI0_9HYPO|nr:hypothetical protein TGAMA5MH_10081 [Trichoderma gamsii]